MPDAALMVLALLAAIAGMAGFALANAEHWRQLFPARPRSGAARSLCRVGGVAGVGASLLCCVLADPLTMAILVWPMLLGIAAAAVAALLTWRARSGAPAAHRTVRNEPADAI